MSDPSVTTPQQITERVLSSFEGCPDDRLRELMQALAGHLHAFVSEVGLTREEWERAIAALTRDRRDHRRAPPGVRAVVRRARALDARRRPRSRLPPGATESTVLGPFYVAGVAAARLRRRRSPQRATPATRRGSTAACSSTRRRADRRRRARRLAERQRPALRGPASRGARRSPARPLSNRADGSFALPRGAPGAVSDSGRRPGRSDAAGDRSPSVAPGAHPHDRPRRRPPDADHAHLRRRQRVSGLRRRVRGQAVARPPVHHRSADAWTEPRLCRSAATWCWLPRIDVRRLVGNSCPSVDTRLVRIAPRPP